jgi:hypothetical protein
VVREVDGLAALQVGVAGERQSRWASAGVDERLHERGHAVDRRDRLVADVHGHVRGDLVVARPGGVELAADRAGELGDAPLDRHVDVDVVGRERERALGELDLDLLERRVQRVAVLGGDDVLRGQHPGVRAGLRDVVGPQPPVVGQRAVERAERVVGGFGEAAAHAAAEAS